MSERIPNGKKAFAYIQRMKKDDSRYNVILAVVHVTEWGESMELDTIVAVQPTATVAQAHADRINEALALTWRDL